MSEWASSTTETHHWSAEHPCFRATVSADTGCRYYRWSACVTIGGLVDNSEDGCADSLAEAQRDAVRAGVALWARACVISDWKSWFCTAEQRRLRNLTLVALEELAQ